MAGIYIPGMEIPKRGHTVTLTIMGGGEAVVQYYDCKPQLTVPIVYKAVPVPPHGRTIDADEYQAKMKNAYDDDWFTVLEATPTVVPADKVEEGET